MKNIKYSSSSQKLFFWLFLILFFLFIVTACSAGLRPQRVVCREYAEVQPTAEGLFRLPDVRTPLPPEMVANREQTNGVLFGGIALVLIVIGGTLGVIRQNQ